MSQSTMDQLVDKYPFLVHLPLYHFYADFDGIVDPEDTDNCCNNIARNERRSEDVVNVCKKLKRNIKRLFVESNEKITPDNSRRCEYLKYWFNDKIMKHGFPHDSIVTLHNKWDAYAKDLLESGNKCEHDPYYDDCGDVQLIELLTDIHNNYDNEDYNILSELSRYPDPTVFCNFVRECVEIYKKWKIGCLKNSSSHFCTMLDKYKKINIEEIFQSLTCEEKLSLEVSLPIFVSAGYIYQRPSPTLPENGYPSMSNNTNTSLNGTLTFLKSYSIGISFLLVILLFFMFWSFIHKVSKNIFKNVNTKKKRTHCKLMRFYNHELIFSE
ncbi:PIR protein [Plasmodium ovale]|uniref:PIR protein n=1 Tax=Plasmodium ovale TaxID=36330 RepID=A0A1D3JCS8_PLAOA|nr:PIR protein [Plasmodium ovale]